MTVSSKIEKFSNAELVNLRSELMRAGIDSWQAADVVSDFLVGRGYGVSPQGARAAVGRLQGPYGSLDCMQEELERLACVM